MVKKPSRVLLGGLFVTSQTFGTCHTFGPSPLILDSLLANSSQLVQPCVLIFFLPSDCRRLPHEFPSIHTRPQSLRDIVGVRVYSLGNIEFHQREYTVLTTSGSFELLFYHSAVARSSDIQPHSMPIQEFRRYHRSTSPIQGHPQKACPE